jgi:hypothetical protein
MVVTATGVVAQAVAIAVVDLETAARAARAAREGPAAAVDKGAAEASSATIVPAATATAAKAVARCPGVGLAGP